MPWKIVSGKGGWFVVKEDTGKPIHKRPHKTRGEAEAHLRALYVNEKRANK
jgi:hypothetical protein